MENEYILCAAIWFDDGNQYTFQPKGIKSGLVFCGHRHHVIFELVGASARERREEWGIYEKDQGFLTNTNRFVTREEAAEIALKSGQIKDPVTRLFSEDIY